MPTLARYGKNWNPSTNVRPAQPPRHGNISAMPTATSAGQPAWLWSINPSPSGRTKRSPRKILAALTALCALARHGDKALQGKLIAALDRLDWAKLDLGQKAELLRVYQLAFIRMGQPDAKIAAAVEKKLDAVYPAPVPALNYELSTLLVYLESPNAASKTLALMSQSSDQTKHNWSPNCSRAMPATPAPLPPPPPAPRSVIRSITPKNCAI